MVEDPDPDAGRDTRLVIHHSDAQILAAALEANVDYLVSWNTKRFHARSVQEFVDFPVVTPAECSLHSYRSHLSQVSVILEAFSIYKDPRPFLLRFWHRGRRESPPTTFTAPCPLDRAVDVLRFKPEIANLLPDDRQSATRLWTVTSRNTTMPSRKDHRSNPCHAVPDDFPWKRDFGFLSFSSPA